MGDEDFEIGEKYAIFALQEAVDSAIDRGLDPANIEAVGVVWELTAQRQPDVDAFDPNRQPSSEGF